MKTKTLENALKELANPNQQLYIKFRFCLSEQDEEEIVFANLKHALANKALIAKYNYVTNRGNHFIAN